MSRDKFTERSRPGFTAIELMVVLAIFLVSTTAVLPFFGTFQQQETLATVSQDTLQTLKRAQHRAMSGQRDRAWGVRFTERGFTLYGGVTYAERQRQLDEVHRVDTSFTFSGLPEVTFRKIQGTPSGTGTITIAHPEGGAARITVNDAGGIFLE